MDFKKKYTLFILSLLLNIPFIVNAQWQQIGADIDGDTAYEYFGRAMNLSPDGSVVAVGSQANPKNSFSSFVRCYRNNTGNWESLGNDIATVNGDNSDAIALSANGSIIAIGSIRDGVVGGQSNYDGHVKVFELIANNWEQIGNDIEGTGAENSGAAISISSDGSVLAIGAHFNDENGNDAGQVRIYRNNAGNWEQIGENISGDAAFDNFGFTVDLNVDGSVLAIGAPFHNNNSGQTKIYQNIDDNWEQVGSNILGQALDVSGYSVSINDDGSVIAISSLGNGQVKIFQNNANNWEQIGNNIIGEEEDSLFGVSISLSANGSVLAIGASRNSGNGFRAGHTQVYKNNAGSWQQLYDDIDGEAVEDNFGETVSLSANGGIVAVSGFLNDGNGFQAGHVQVFEDNNLGVATNGLSESIISVFPNPSNGQFHIKTNVSYRLSIIDISGKLVYSKSIDKNAATIRLQNVLSSGLYFINFKSTTQNFTIKHIVE